MLVTILFFLALTTSTIQAQTTIAEQLAGTWQFDEITSFSTIEPATRAKMDSIPGFKTQLLNAYRGRSTFFGSDGSYKVTLADGRSSTGSWQLTTSGEVQLTDPEGNVSYQRIGTLQNNHLVLIPVTSDGFKSIIKQWHFVKL
ncbi:hypothetical protein GWK08_05315 [Leptobacterium flavescens]|uniref:Uncharacterized protein n=1 Tax=Leptobacterium flavescens TaxID=472055 RepID=A0A6P0ULR5_9FLAO|nr:lipocalin family protein [Leptobacterium flavescens]NER12849.1 hypothetical protein [Leptobacterium flavescens]